MKRVRRMRERHQCVLLQWLDFLSIKFVIWLCFCFFLVLFSI
jgi:hypothetical protein